MRKAHDTAATTSSASAPVPPSSGRGLWRWSAVLALTALACGVLLTGLSVWFLASVALAGATAAALTFNFHIPAALVRLFALGRTVAKYGERLVGHNAALRDQVDRRVALFNAMAVAPATRSVGWQFGDQDRLADYIDDVEDLDYAKLRADLPAMAATAGFLACLAATVAVVPLAALPISALLVSALALAWSHGNSLIPQYRAVRQLRRAGAQQTGAAIASAVPLQAERAWPRMIEAAIADFTHAGQRLLFAQLGAVTLDAFTALIAPLAAISVFSAAWLSGARSTDLLVPTFLAFAWLAMGDAATGVSRIVAANVRRHLAQGEIGHWTDTLPQVAPQAAPPHRISSLDAVGLQRRAPDGRRIGNHPLSLHLAAGRPTILLGASGCGKTSLLKQIAGWIGNDVMTAGDNTFTPEARRMQTCLCLHDASILSDTARANLFAPWASDDDIRGALEAVELWERIAQAGGLDGWIAQDTLSLGEAQRLNLARVWLSDRPIVLLDEPAEHLDELQGKRILRRLLDRLSERIVVFSSHRTTDPSQTEAIRL